MLRVLPAVIVVLNLLSRLSHPLFFFVFFFSHPQTPVPPQCHQSFLSLKSSSGSVSGDGTVIPLSPCRVDVLFAFPGDPFRPLSGSAQCLLYKQPRLGQKTWLLVLGVLCLRPAARAGLSDRA